jgi:regulator of ribosome biosynthesis
MKDNVAFDLKHMMACDIAPVSPESDIQALTTENVQLLVNEIFQLPREKTDVGPVVRLDKLEFLEQLPRMRPLPKPKHKSKWERFAEERGISKKKRSRLVYDKASKDWVPRWGANSIKHKADKQDWVMEVPLKSNEDPFEKKRIAAQLEKAKQKLREAKNKVYASGEVLPAGVNETLVSGKKRSKDAINEVLRRAQVSSGSAGKFDRRIESEKVIDQGKRKKLLSGNMSEEKTQSLKIMNSVLKGASANIDRKVIPIGAPKKGMTQEAIRRMKQTNRKKVR